MTDRQIAADKLKKLKKQVEAGARPGWIEDSVATLMDNNHRFADILEYTLPQFLILLAAAERRDAERRTRFVTDIGVTLGGLLGGGDSFSKHLDSLQAVVNEEKKDGSQK